MAHSILLLPGDGIGPEIMGPVGALLERIGTVTGQALTLETALVGGCAIDAEGMPLPASTLEAARKADAILLGAVGGPKWDACRRRNVRSGGS